MRQEITSNSIIRGWALLLSILCVALVWTACQTTPINDFSKIQNDMTKDEVLNIIGSPTRTERASGKDKWAYRFWVGDDHNKEALRQVTFLNGRVVSYGEDTDEEKRIKDIKQDDADRAEKRRVARERALSPVPASQQDPVVSIKQTDDGEPKHPIEDDFVEQKGKHAPVTHSEE